MVDMTATIAAALREPFPEAAVGYLPKIWCKACSEAKKQRRPSCDNHTRKRCQVCRNSITEAHVDLSYVGHAEVTDRLIAVDPEWTWEPMAFGADGLPALDQHGGLWIRLTVAGVTKPGYGGAEGKTGPDAVKELIGDALRNAALRFGVAINLWGAHGKGEALAELAGLTGEAPEGSHTDTPAPTAPTEAMAVTMRAEREDQDPDGTGPPIVGAATRSRRGPQGPQRPAPPPAQADVSVERGKAWKAAQRLEMTQQEFASDFSTSYSTDVMAGTAAQFAEYARHLDALASGRDPADSQVPQGASA